MDPFVTLREMWREAGRKRALIAFALVISTLLGMFVALRPGLPPESRQYTVWLASADILVDTADSQVVDAKGPDFLSLANRTSLLGNLLGTKPLRTAIAEAAGVEPNLLVVVPPANTSTTATGETLAPTPVTTAASRKLSDSEAAVLTVSTDSSLPILRVTAQAPDASTASRLTTATTTQLEQHLHTVGAAEEIPAARKLVLRPLAAPTPAPEVRGTPRALGLLTTILVALLSCGAIVTAPMVARRWRNAESAENAEAVESGEALTAADFGPNASADPGSNVPFDRAADRGRARQAVAEFATAGRREEPSRVGRERGGVR